MQWCLCEYAQLVNDWQLAQGIFINTRHILFFSRTHIYPSAWRERTTCSILYKINVGVENNVLFCSVFGNIIFMFCVFKQCCTFQWRRRWETMHCVHHHPLFSISQKKKERKTEAFLGVIMWTYITLCCMLKVSSSHHIRNKSLCCTTLYWM